MRLLRVAALLLVLALLLVVGCRREETGKPTSAAKPAAAMAPDFTLRTVDGSTVRLSSYRGKVVFLNFWATWCPPCVAELPSMERLNEVLAGKDFVMLTVNADEDLEEGLKPFLQEHPHRFLVVSDAEAVAQRLYNVNKFPETFIIGKDGRVIEHVVGARDWASVEALKWFTSLVDGK